MENKFSGRFLKSLLSSIFWTGILSGFILLVFTSESDTPFDIPILAFILVVPFVFYGKLKDEDDKVLKQYENDTKLIKDGYENKISQIEHESRGFSAQAQVLETSLKEKSFGYPTLHESIDYFHKLIDDYIANQLLIKSHPAPKASEAVQEQSKRRREAEKKQKITQLIIEFYEDLQPSLVDYKNDEFGNEDEILAEWTKEEKEDPVTYLVTKEEYRRLSEAERNQLALDRYWKRPHSKWHIGIMYERYVGYLYEKEGYEVSYYGIEKGKEDLGRDLIAQKDNELVIIQCKYWSQFKTIYEKYIFQFFGTVFQYKDSNKDKTVRGMFYATTKLSPLAKRFAKELGIELEEEFGMDKSYPCIKCNVSESNETKIYHLPFDQQYDRVKIEPHKGEFYCATTKEAEEKGFRRAWRWKGGQA